MGSEGNAKVKMNPTLAFSACNFLWWSNQDYEDIIKKKMMEPDKQQFNLKHRKDGIEVQRV